MKQEQLQELSYYRLSLLSHLQESYPWLVSDTEFINTRSDQAAEVYCQVILSGEDHQAAEEAANEVLFEGLHVSALDILITVLWNEFSQEIPESEAPALALQLLPQCKGILKYYVLSDNFPDSAEYDTLYTELTGFIVIYLEENGLQ